MILLTYVDPHVTELTLQRKHEPFEKLFVCFWTLFACISISKFDTFFDLSNAIYTTFIDWL